MNVIFSCFVENILIIDCGIQMKDISLYQQKMITNNLKIKAMLDLNTITKEDFVNELILSDDFADFYYPNEKALLSLDFDFEEMKKEFEKWLQNNSNTFEIW